MTEDNELIENEGTHTARHIASLRALSEWLIANDHDMALPDSVDIDPEDSADKMAAMMIELVSLRTEVAAYRNHQVEL